MKEKDLTKTIRLVAEYYNVISNIGDEMFYRLYFNNKNKINIDWSNIDFTGEGMDKLRARKKLALNLNKFEFVH